MIYDLKRVKQNVRHAIKIKGMSIGSIEVSAGVSTGYISRPTKDIPLRVIYEVAQATGYTIEELIEKDFSEEAKNTRIAELKAEIARLESDNNGK